MPNLLSTIRIAAFLLITLVAVSALAQNDVRRTTIAITYPLNQTIELPLRAMPKFEDKADVELGLN